jgi:uncharacterized membrane protein YraQ (UPF0718 family)
MTCWRNVALSFILAIPLILIVAVSSAYLFDPPVSILVSIAGGLVIGHVASGLFGPMWDETC